MQKDTTTRTYQDINGYPKVLGRLMVIIIKHTKLKDKHKRYLKERDSIDGAIIQNILNT